MTTPKHQRLIYNVYPAKAGDTSANGTALSYLVYYAKTRPEKLTKVGTFLEKKLEADKSARNHVHVKITLEIVDNLISSCHGNMNLFGPFVLRIVLSLLHSSNVEWINFATSTFLRLVSVESHDLSSSTQTETREQFVLVTSSFVGLSRVTGTSDDSNKLRLAGLKGLLGIVRAQNILRSENQAILSDVLPVIWPNLKAMTQADLQAFSASQNPMEIAGNQNNCVIVALTIIRDVSVRATATSVPIIVHSLFTWMDESKLWENKISCEPLIQLVQSSLNAQYGHVIVTELEKRLSGQNPKDQSEIYRTRVISVLNLVIAKAEGNFSISVLELLDVLINHFIPAPLELPSQMHQGQSEDSLQSPEGSPTTLGGQDINQALFTSIGILFSSLTVNQVKYDSLALVLQRLFKENEKKKTEEDFSLLGPYLQALFLISRTNSESDYVVVFNPQVLLGFADLMLHSSRVVRLSTFGIIAEIISHFVPADEASTISAKAVKDNSQRFFSQFSGLFHQRIYRLLTSDYVVPSDLSAIFDIERLLINLHGPDEIGIIVPLLFALQIHARSIDTIVSGGATTHLAFNHFVFSLLSLIANTVDIPSLKSWSQQQKFEMEAYHWRPWLDFNSPAVLKRLNKEKSFAKLEKKEQKKDDKAASFPSLIAALSVNVIIDALAGKLSDYNRNIKTILQKPYSPPTDEELQPVVAPVVTAPVPPGKGFRRPSNLLVFNAEDLKDSTPSPSLDKAASQLFENVPEITLTIKDTITFDLSSLTRYKPHHLDVDSDVEEEDDDDDDDSSSDEEDEINGRIAPSKWPLRNPALRV